MTDATIAISGAASGLGRALTETLRSSGSTVVTVDLHSVEISADLSSSGGRAAAVAGVLERTNALAGIVPCAGLGPQHPSERIVAVNFFGAVAFVEGLEGAVESGGAVVLICSNSTTLTPGADGDLARACLNGDEVAALAIAADTNPAVAYAASKVAIAKWMRTKVESLGERGVRINAVAPGAFHTPLLQEGLDDPATGDLIKALPIPLGRVGEPDDIAEVVAWLLSDRARYVHGSTLFADGGTDALLSPNRFP